MNNDIIIKNGIIIFTKLYFRESLVTYDEDKDPDSQKISVAHLIALEMAHQWFGGIVTPAWWSDEWLTEGLTIYFQLYVLDKVGLQCYMFAYVQVEKPK